MPIAPQITNTPIDLIYFEITAVSHTSSTATYTAVGHTYTTGDTVTVSGLDPDGYNGVFTVTSTATNTFTVANTTNAAVTVATGDSYGQAADSDFDANYTPLVYMTDTEDLADPDVNPALAQAQQAISDANAAKTVADAAAARSATALQTSSNTIVNSSNQLTAINGNGVTVYAGASSTSGARVLLNSSGITGFNSSGSPTFAVNAGTGAVDITGNINAISGYFGTPSNGWSISSTGLTAVGTGNLTGGSIVGTQFTGYGGNFSVSTTGYLIASSGTIAGWTLTPTYFTNTGADTFLYANPGSDGLAYSTIGRGIMRRLQLNGASGTTLAPTTVLGVGGNAVVDGDIYATAAISASTTAATNCYITTTGQIRKTSTTSSQRYKENITNIVNVAELDPKALLSLPVRAFTYKEGHIPADDDRYMQMLPGFIAEEVDQAYPIAVDYVDGVETWNPFYIIPALLFLIQDQEKRIVALEGK